MQARCRGHGVGSIRPGRWNPRTQHFGHAVALDVHAALLLLVQLGKLRLQELQHRQGGIHRKRRIGHRPNDHFNMRDQVVRMQVGDEFAFFQRHQHESVVAPRLDAELEFVLRKLLAKFLAHRYGPGLDVGRVLQAALKRLGCIVALHLVQQDDGSGGHHLVSTFDGAAKHRFQHWRDGVDLERVPHQFRQGEQARRLTLMAEFFQDSTFASQEEIVAAEMRDQGDRVEDLGRRHGIELSLEQGFGNVPVETFDATRQAPVLERGVPELGEHEVYRFGVQACAGERSRGIQHVLRLCDVHLHDERGLTAEDDWPGHSVAVGNGPVADLEDRDTGSALFVEQECDRMCLGMREHPSENVRVTPQAFHHRDKRADFRHDGVDRRSPDLLVGAKTTHTMPSSATPAWKSCLHRPFT